jgi:hypothetical protein
MHPILILGTGRESQQHARHRRALRPTTVPGCLELRIGLKHANQPVGAKHAREVLQRDSNLPAGIFDSKPFLFVPGENFNTK